MWRRYPGALVLYGEAICNEWISRGFHDTLRERITEYAQDGSLPHWLGRESFHASHRANLLRKDPKWYSQFGWKDCPLLPYEWPEGEPNVHSS